MSRFAISWYIASHSGKAGHHPPMDIVSHTLSHHSILSHLASPFFSNKHSYPQSLQNDCLPFSLHGEAPTAQTQKRCSRWYKARACASLATQQATFIHGVARTIATSTYSKGVRLFLAIVTVAGTRVVCSSRRRHTLLHSQARSAGLSLNTLSRDWSA